MTGFASNISGSFYYASYGFCDLAEYGICFWNVGVVMDMRCCGDFFC